MVHGRRPTETDFDCKLKAVNPPFRSVSTPRARKDLRVVGRVNPASAAGPASLTDWCAERHRERFRIETTSRADSDAVRGASRVGACVAQVLRSASSELA